MTTRYILEWRSPSMVVIVSHPCSRPILPPPPLASLSCQKSTFRVWRPEPFLCVSAFTILAQNYYADSLALL